jgi:energy-coupling factor transport system ATP-binding protein
MVSIEIDTISFGYGHDESELLFVDFSLEIPAGQRVAIVGPSGAGKTTLIKLMKGVLRPQAGEIRVNGTPLPPGELNHLAACAFSNPENQIVSPVVAEDVGFGLENGGFDPETIRARTEEVLRRVGLWERAADFTHHLSGGEQQRLIFAGALALRTGCLLLDDPLSMVDCRGRNEMLRLVGEIHRQEAITLVHTTHLLEEALSAQRLVAMDGGKILFTGAPGQFLENEGLIERLGLEMPAIAQLARRLVRAGCSEARGVTSLDEVLALLTVR